MIPTGTKFGRYEIRSQLGAGGMGEVYLAEDISLNRKVAIKFLPPALITDEHARKRLLREAQAAAKLDHPNICTIHEVAEEDGRSFIVMQYVEGETLAARLKRQPLKLDEALDVSLQIGEALSEAHTHGIAHLDIKPQNIMLTPSGRVTVLDFGVAKMVGTQGLTGDEAKTQSLLTTAGTIVGTPGYMSPEQARGESLDERSDIFSLGVVLYEMIAGRTPFEGSTASDVLAAILLVEPPPLKQFVPELPTQLEQITTRALAKDRKKRYQTVKDLALELKSLKQELELEANLERSSRLKVSAGTLEAKSVELENPTADFSPFKTHAYYPNNLPVQPTPFIGRDLELAAVEKMLRQSELRLVTLTGPGGMGKTRLGLQVADRLIREFRDGVYLVSLAPLNDAALVASAIAQTLDTREAGGSPLGESLKQHLRDKRMLLLLDNFEQVVSAAPLLADLLAACPHLKMLVTSREVLQLRGEHEFSVPPLALPDLKHLPPMERLALSPSIALFIERARAVKPDFALTTANAQAVAETCTQLDGLPLAIELAAARIKLLPPQAILQRLESRLKLLTGGARDLPTRQQTMRGTIAWSYDLLDASEKLLFNRLSTFAGGCTLEAAEAVCRDASDVDMNVLEGVAALVNKSLLQQEQADSGTRLVMLETIREYGLECLRSSVEVTAIERGHATFFLGLAEMAAAELLGPSQTEWLDRLDLEHDNLRAALAWMTQSGEAEPGLLMALALWRFWEIRGYLAEGRASFAGLLALPGSSAQRKLRMKALYAAGILADAQGDYALARTLFEENLAINREVSDKWGTANSLNNLGIVALRQQDYPTARSLYEESLAIWRELGNQRAIALSLDNLGNVAGAQGDYATARLLHEESLMIFRELGDSRGMAWSLNHLGDVARDELDYAPARSRYEESLAMFSELGDQPGIASSLADLGNLARDQGDYSSARPLYEESLVIFGELGDGRGIARVLEGLAGLAAARAQPDRALRLAGAVAALRESLGAPLPPIELARLERSLEPAWQSVAKLAGSAIWREGRAILLEEAINYALRPETD
jgi:predicted ATPase/serine/threonine protein kinase